MVCYVPTTRFKKNPPNIHPGYNFILGEERDRVIPMMTRVSETKEMNAVV